MKVSSNLGYSHKFKKYQQHSRNDQLLKIRPKYPVKLQSLSPNASQRYEKNSNVSEPRNKSVIPNNSIIRVIEEKSIDYETALLQHLRFTNISRGSDYEECTPLTKVKIITSPIKFGLNLNKIFRENGKETKDYVENYQPEKNIKGKFQMSMDLGKNKLENESIGEIKNFYPELVKKKLSY